MALFRLGIDEAGLVVNYNGETLTVPFGLAEGPEEAVVIWDDTVTAREVSARHSAWFSERLGMACKLVFFPEENIRPARPALQSKQRTRKSGRRLSAAHYRPVVARRSQYTPGKPRAHGPVPTQPRVFGRRAV